MFPDKNFSFAGASYILIILLICLMVMVARAEFPNCPECGCQIENTSAFCEQCGAALPQETTTTKPTCPGCGEPCNTPYCRYCGTKNEEN